MYKHISSNNRMLRRRNLGHFHLALTGHLNMDCKNLKPLKEQWIDQKRWLLIYKINVSYSSACIRNSVRRMKFCSLYQLHFRFKSTNQLANKANTVQLYGLNYSIDIHYRYIDISMYSNEQGVRTKQAGAIKLS